MEEGIEMKKFLVFIFFSFLVSSLPAMEKQTETFFVLGGNAGVGGGGMNYTIIDAFASETNAGSSSSSNINMADPSFSPRFSARLAKVSNYGWLFKSAKPNEKPAKKIWGWAGWGIQYDYTQSYQHGVASKVLFYDFNSENNIFTPGIQLLSPGRGVGLFAGLIGIGHSRVDFIPGPNYDLMEDLVELGLEWIGEEANETFPEGKPTAKFSTAIYPVVVKILPVQLDIWCFGPIGLNIAFSGLQLWAGESALNLDWEDGTQKTIDTGFVWIRNFQIEIGLSLRL